MGDFSVTFGVALVVYVLVMFGISIWARGRVESTEDYLVAGRRLPLSLAWATLFATWFGAGTLLTATEEVRVEGLRVAGLDPIGAGVCLLLAGAFYAGPLWRMKLLTLADFFARRFGPRAELLASVCMIPGYCGWIAAQFVALAGVLQLFFGLDPVAGIAIIAVVGTGYTLIGGMWSVTLTDAIQLLLLLVGLVILFVTTLGELGDGGVADGLKVLIERTPEHKLVLVPVDRVEDFVGWVAVFTAGALGNLPGQDLFQRVFSSKSEKVAKRACLVAGVAYLVVGAMPLATGMAGTLLFPDADDVSILPYLAERLLHPALAVVFLLAVASAVLSTIDSAILSPASVLSQNILSRLKQERLTSLGLNQVSVVGIAAVSLAVAYIGEDAYSLLESAYEVGVVSLLVPLTMGLFVERGGERSALAAMVTGTVLWLWHLVIGWEHFAEPLLGPLGVPLPAALTSAAISFGVYAVASRRDSR